MSVGDDKEGVKEDDQGGGRMRGPGCGAKSGQRDG